MISVAMATYNGAEYIKEQLNSILNQTMKVDEIVICDDGSSDDTISIIKEYLENNSCIKLFQNEENLGYTDNFKKAIMKTTGDFILLSDQDDIWKCDKVESLIDFMDKNGCMAVCSDYEIIDGNSEIVVDGNYRVNRFIRKNGQKEKCEIKFINLVFGNIAQGCTYCFKKDVKYCLDRIKSKAVVHDQQIMFIATLMGKVYYLNKKLIQYRIHGNNAIGIKNKSNVSIDVKMPSKKPFMVSFFEELNSAIRVPWYYIYLVFYYLRIPYVYSVICNIVYRK